MSSTDRTATFTATPRMGVARRVKQVFSLQHFGTAQFFASKALAIEQLSGGDYARASLEHGASVTSAVILSVAFLEASINEFYQQALDGSTSRLAGLNPSQLATLGSLWEIVDRGNLLSKYQVALSACGRARFDQGTEPFQSADGLVRMRNALIHFRPEWSDELKVHKDIEDRLKGRFAEHAKAYNSALWFPNKCLGAGCAVWAVETVEKFMTEFCNRLGIASRLP